MAVGTAGNVKTLVAIVARLSGYQLHRVHDSLSTIRILDCLDNNRISNALIKCCILRRLSKNIPRMPKITSKKCNTEKSWRGSCESRLTGIVTPATPAPQVRERVMNNPQKKEEDTTNPSEMATFVLSYVKRPFPPQQASYEESRRWGRHVGWFPVSHDVMMRYYVSVERRLAPNY